MICLRGALSLLCALAVLTLVACGGGGGGGDGFGCTGSTCTASFQGPGEQDLSEELGAGATVELLTVGAGSATVRVAGRKARLVKNRERSVAGYMVTLTEADGEDVALRITGE